ncbi:HupE/UreJ family protein [uncultured Shimia sp.]|uniref:HupE/UreJ family protein n=1 Tax=uncultured Shimia sp. TaxID=573152 RepID=UPI00262B32DC|nr:HupE/UreJ family protein [uncultured Shimia sp.]
MLKFLQMRMTRRWFAVFVLSTALMVAFGMTTKVGAHFLLNLNVRIYHIEHVQDGLIVHMRTPMPYLVADKLGNTDGDALPAPAPFTTNAMMDDQLVHFVDPASLTADPLGIGQIAETSLVLLFDGKRQRGTVEAVEVSAIGKEPAFATLDEAQLALATTFEPSNLPKDLFVGDAVVDVSIRYTTHGYVDAYTLASQVDPGLPEQDKTANLILDYGPGEPKVSRARGLLLEPVEVSRSRISAIVTFVWEGIHHILEGLDHVLFVVCLVLGAQTLRSLLGRVTGFTIGHSVTLVLGFFGFVPKGEWFVPAVETGIAISIIYAGILIFRNGNDGGNGRKVFVVTLLLGLLHGLGFSFVLHDILQVSSPNIWQSLLAFNIGVELGQVFIVLAIWPLFAVLKTQAPRLDVITRNGAAIGCIAIALMWSFERTAQLVATLG